MTKPGLPREPSDLARARTRWLVWYALLNKAEHAAIRGAEEEVREPAWRRHTPGEARWPVTLSVIVAIVGWLGIFAATGRKPMLASLGAAGAGILVYLGRALWSRQWPFEEAR